MSFIILSVNIFKRILLIGDTRRDYCLMCLSGPCQGSAVYRAKEVPSFLKYFKTLSMGPPSLGIEPTTFRSAVRRSFDVAYLAAATNTSTVSNTGSLSYRYPRIPTISFIHSISFTISLFQGDASSSFVSGFFFSAEACSKICLFLDPLFLSNNCSAPVRYEMIKASRTLRASLAVCYFKSNAYLYRVWKELNSWDREFAESTE